MDTNRKREELCAALSTLLSRQFRVPQGAKIVVGLRSLRLDYWGWLGFLANHHRHPSRVELTDFFGGNKEGSPAQNSAPLAYNDDGLELDWQRDYPAQFATPGLGGVAPPRLRKSPSSPIREAGPLRIENPSQGSATPLLF